MKTQRAKSKTRILTAAALCAIIAVCAAAVAFAGTGLLSPSATQVTAGSSLSFTVNLSDIKDEYAQTEESFTLTVEISPDPEAVSVSPGVSMNQFGSKYTISSADLSAVTSLKFTVYPGSGITENTTYTVSASIAGGLSTLSDSFTFTAVPASDNPGGKGGKGGSGKIKSAGSAISASGGTSTDTSTVYQGSADNYLKKLSVEGYDFTEKFNSTRDTYFVEVPEDVDSLEISATARDSSAAVRIAGNDDISGDNSKILISVTADNGDVRTYRIFVTHTDKEQTDTEQTED